MTDNGIDFLNSHCHQIDKGCHKCKENITECPPFCPQSKCNDEYYNYQSKGKPCK